LPDTDTIYSGNNRGQAIFNVKSDGKHTESDKNDFFDVIYVILSTLIKMSMEYRLPVRKTYAPPVWKEDSTESKPRVTFFADGSQISQITVHTKMACKVMHAFLYKAIFNGILSVIYPLYLYKNGGIPM